MSTIRMTVSEDEAIFINLVRVLMKAGPLPYLKAIDMALAICREGLVK